MAQRILSAPRSWEKGKGTCSTGLYWSFPSLQGTALQLQEPDSLALSKAAISPPHSDENLSYPLAQALPRGRRPHLHVQGFPCTCAVCFSHS